MKNLKVMSLLHALGVGIYVAGIVLFITNTERIFFNDDFTGPIIMLLIFVLSAAITGFLIIGKPILLYIDNKKKEAVEMFFYTVGWLIIILMLAIIYKALTY